MNTSFTPWLAASGCMLLSMTGLNAKENPSVKNVLFIAIDDLQTALHCYGAEGMITPNIDQLAGQSVLFDRHYCTVPFSGPSRASMWTGLYPTPDRFTNFARAEDQVPDVLVMPEQFRRHGYRTISLGKVFHHGDDFASAWDVLDEKRDYYGYQDPANQQRQKEDQELAAKNIASIDFSNLAALPHDFQAPQGPAFECVDVPDEAYPDGQNTLRAIEELKKAKASGQHFFLAIGYYRPHGPFIAPKKYWDMYPNVGLSDNPLFPPTAPQEARQATQALYLSLSGIPHYEDMPDSTARRIRQGYYAGVTYTDALVGKLMAAIDRLGLREETIVVLWGDNGYLLGDHEGWGKLSHFHEALRVPFMISAPGMAQGERCSGLTSSADIYPTLCQLAGLDIPSHAQGTSMVPHLEDPSAHTTHQAVFSRLNSGESVVTNRYAYTEWTPADSTKAAACMLYDLAEDPEEKVNLALQPKYREKVAEMSRLIAEHKAAVAHQDSLHDYGEPNPDMSTNPFE